MGVTLSKCVSMAGQEVYLADTYTVVRTSGEQQAGFLLTEKIHSCVNTAGTTRVGAHAFLKELGWSLHLHNGDQDEANLSAHCCGFRRLGTFWPTRLTGDQSAIDAWTEALQSKLEELAGYQGLPDHWADHQCGRGAPADYCDGCCAHTRAEKKKQILNDLAAVKLEKQGAVADQLEALENKEVALLAALEKIPTAAQHRKWLAEKKEREDAEARAAAAAELAARAASCALPEPMDQSLRNRIVGSMPTPEAPTMHGCAYADSDCPWSICYACEYEKGPAAYEQKIRHSNLIKLISAYWRNTRKGEQAKGWSNQTLEAILAFLDTPRADRKYTELQILDTAYAPDWRDSSLVCALRALMKA